MKEDYVCDVPNCGKRFARKWRLECHKSLHENKKPFKCSVEGCGAAYAWSQHLKRHIEKIHSQPEKQYQCTSSMCLATFDSEQALSQHYRKVHSVTDENKKFYCQSCDQKFVIEWQLREHQSSHTGEKPFKCDQCNAEFGSHSDYQKHERSHNPEVRRRRKTETPKRYMRCRNCSEQFSSSKDLKEHVAECSVEARTCKECSVVFQRKHHLVAHMVAAHGGEDKSFKCPVDGCDRTYSYEKNLKHHVKTSHDRVVYPCEKCPRQLCTKQKYLLHMEKVHNNPSQEPKKRRPVSVKKKLAKKLCGDSDTNKKGIDVDVTARRKPVTKKNHFSHVVNSKLRHCAESLDHSNPIYAKENSLRTAESEIPISEY